MRYGSLALAGALACCAIAGPSGAAPMSAVTEFGRSFAVKPRRPGLVLSLSPASATPSFALVLAPRAIHLRLLLWIPT